VLILTDHGVNDITCNCYESIMRVPSIYLNGCIQHEHIYSTSKTLKSKAPVQTSALITIEHASCKRKGCSIINSIQRPQSIDDILVRDKLDAHAKNHPERFR